MVVIPAVAVQLRMSLVTCGVTQFREPHFRHSVSPAIDSIPISTAHTARFVRLTPNELCSGATVTFRSVATQLPLSLLIVSWRGAPQRLRQSVPRECNWESAGLADGSGGDIGATRLNVRTFGR